MPRCLPLIFPAALGVLLSGCAPALPSTGAPTVEVVLMVGQSNMSGRGQGDDPLAGSAASSGLLMWDPASSQLTPAREPLPHQDLGVRPVAAGPGLSFGRAWLARGAPGSRLVLVPAAFGGTGFSDQAGSWRVTGAHVSPLTAEAVARANAAMRAARAGGAAVRLAAILWHQGETDGGNAMPASAYASELVALAGYLRTHIDGASARTPFVVGQYVPSQIAGSAALAAIADVNRALPAQLPYSACVGSQGLHGNPAPDAIHFNAASQRVMGERYAAALDALLAGAPAAPCRWQE